MKNLIVITLILIFCGSSSAQLISPSTSPNKTQQLLIDRGYGMFIHFGINTFGEVEWSDGTIPAEKYNPTSLDCDQWVRIARDAGFRYVLLTTKHHDGFCLWDSKFTNYDVASSPVKTDVVAEVSKACKKYGLKFAVYYSLWDRHEPLHKEADPQKYIDYMLNQLTEIFTNYGEICELWLDGGWAKKQDQWGIEQLYALVKKYQPNCAFGVNHTIVYEEGKRDFVIPDDMIADNKYYFQYFPGDFRLWDPKIAHLSDKKQYLHNGKSYYMPFEHTICISKQWTWFQKANPVPVRDLDELEELFYWCTANQNSLVVDIPPAKSGKLFEHEANTAIALGKRLNIQKEKPLPKNGQFISLAKPANASSVYNQENEKFGAQFAVDGGMQTRWAAKDTLTDLVVKLNPTDKFNKISIFEYQDTKKGNDPKDYFTNYRFNRIQSYNIDIWKDNEWLTIYHGEESMGDCKVIRFPNSYQTTKIRLNVLKATAPPSIYEFNVIDFEKR
ncbi:MAG: alpha-L-fucosidase [Prolixibacteraceae bacterium]|nr:alpha-L-fucosidase [Prolixibacteraceae bacterium]